MAHVPLFEEAYLDEGKKSDDDSLPHFSSPSIGAPIKLIAEQNKNLNLVILCGHTHGEGGRSNSSQSYCLYGRCRLWSTWNQWSDSSLNNEFLQALDELYYLASYQVVSYYLVLL